MITLVPTSQQLFYPLQKLFILVLIDGVILIYVTLYILYLYYSYNKVPIFHFYDLISMHTFYTNKFLILMF